MRLALACLLCLAPTVARAQLNAPPEQVLPSAPAETRPPSYRSEIKLSPPSPVWTQDRQFTSTRFWLLDPGNFEFQLWYRARAFSDGAANPSEHLFQGEVEWGIAPHLQLDLYGNFQYNVDANGERHLQVEGTQIELRIAIPRYYGQIFGNPVIYLEWHPRHLAPDRAEVRLLLGGAPLPWLLLAVNPYFESNVEPTDDVILDATGKPTGRVSHRFVADAEAGATLAAGFRVTSRLSLSAQAKVGVDMLGDRGNAFHFVAFVGPGFIVKPLGNQHLKIMGTVLFKIAGPDHDASDGSYGAAQGIEPLVIVGSQW